MSNIVNSILSKVFGSKSERDRKELVPYVEKVNAVYQELEALSHDELRAKTNELRKQIDERLQEIDQQIADTRQQVEEEADVLKKEQFFDHIDKLEKDRDEALEVVLEELLPDAFAIMKETARRFKDLETLEVTATDLDRELSPKHDFVKVEGDKAIWQTTWDVIGQPIKWNMLHYDVQIIGGVVLHQGKIAEMATGEGKTLVATFPAFLNALAGRGVHLVTVNDYLAKRDCAWMGPLFQFHGLTVDCVDKHQPGSITRRNAYACDITYGTNNEFGFDYLRDNMVRSPDELVQRKHHFAMIDEVDSVLIDDARTPLIIAGPVAKTGQDEMFYQLKPRIERLVSVQKDLINKLLTEAKKKLATNPSDKEAGLSLFRAFRGLPKSKPLIKFLGETGMKVVLQKTEAIYLAENQKLMPEADAPLYFTIDEKNNLIELTQKGIDFITTSSEDQSFFILPDIGSAIAEIENDDTLGNEDRAKKKEELISDYGVKSERIHTINQLLKAYCLFEKDVEYVLIEDKVKIVDESTGRVMEGRRYSDGLHQALEAKENVKIEDATQTYATVTLQNYFRMYHKLAGMTGTAETEAGEFWEIYKLDVVVIPTNRPIIRNDDNDLVFKTMREKFNAVAEEIQKLVAANRPVLVGTTSVEISELLSRMLTMRKIKHQVLNAKQHQKEAEVVALAGQPGTVTIATNMAGRGTDIKLTPEAKEAGGLAIIGTERHESRRVDRQLRGRSGRQGDPGSSQFFVSLEDNLMRLFGSDRIAKLMDRMGLKEGEVIQHGMVTKSIERAQKKVEENNFGMRKRLLEYDDVMNIQREQIYKRRKIALFGERLEIDIFNMIYDVCEDIVATLQGPDNYDSFQLEVINVFGFDPTISEDDFGGLPADQLTQRLYEQASQHYYSKNEALRKHFAPIIAARYQEVGAKFKNIAIPFTDGKRQIMLEVDFEKTVNSEAKELTTTMEKASTLAIIDQEWKEHLRDMDDLKQSVQLAVHEQKDPLIIYKFESFNLFKGFINRVNRDITAFLMKSGIPIQEPEQVRESQNRPQKQSKIQVQKEEVQSSLSTKNEYHDPTASQVKKVSPVKVEKVASRNERVSVRYNDGRVVKDIKYKKVEDDLQNNLCVLIEE
ncbi:MAG: preprotein translocase subunit SecA [Thermonemataceae bacterium]